MALRTSAGLKHRDGLKRFSLGTPGFRRRNQQLIAKRESANRLDGPAYRTDLVRDQDGKTTNVFHSAPDPGTYRSLVRSNA